MKTLLNGNFGIQFLPSLAAKRLVFQLQLPLSFDLAMVCESI